MSIVRPFRGIKYNLEKVLLKQVIAPPYDVISPEMHDKLMSRSNYNVVRIDLPEGGEDKYEKAGELYRNWRQEQILIKNEQPAFYLYEQVYELDGKQFIRTGFLGLLKLADFGEGVVYPHEKTLSGPKEDRYKLMIETKANLSPVFGLYEDSENSLESIFSDVRKSMPGASAVDDDKVKHSVWQMSDPEIVRKIESLMRDKAIYIADGHHRYETALKYRNDMRKKEGVTEGEERSYGYIMMMFVNFIDSGLTILPIHRVVDVDDNFNDAGFINSVKDSFDIMTLSDKNAVNKYLEDNSNAKGVWGFIGRQGYYGMKIKDTALKNFSSAYKDVDTYLLEHFVLKESLKFTDEKLLAKDGITFEISIDEVEIYLKDRPAVAFIMRPESIETVVNISEKGMTMPQKSTYFYPKLATGLLFNDI